MYQSGTFQGSHKNWSVLKKEAYVIYMSVCKMVLYLKDRLDVIMPPYVNLCT